VASEEKQEEWVPSPVVFASVRKRMKREEMRRFAAGAFIPSVLKPLNPKDIERTCDEDVCFAVTKPRILFTPANACADRKRVKRAHPPRPTSTGLLAAELTKEAVNGAVSS
jgi:hypothetical protein